MLGFQKVRTRGYNVQEKGIVPIRVSQAQLNGGNMQGVSKNQNPQKLTLKRGKGLLTVNLKAGFTEGVNLWGGIMVRNQSL